MSKEFETSPKASYEELARDMTSEQKNRFDLISEVTGDIAPELVAVMAQMGSDEKAEAFCNFQKEYAQYRGAADLVGGRKVIMERRADLSTVNGNFILNAVLCYIEYESGMYGGEYYTNRKRWEIDEVWPGIEKAGRLYEAMRPKKEDERFPFQTNRQFNSLNREDILSGGDRTLANKSIADLCKRRENRSQLLDGDQMIESMLIKMGVNLEDISSKFQSLAKARRAAQESVGPLQAQFEESILSTT